MTSATIEHNNKLYFSALQQKISIFFLTVFEKTQKRRRHHVPTLHISQNGHARSSIRKLMSLSHPNGKNLSKLLRFIAG